MIVVALVKSQIIGIIEMRNDSHIALFFVEKSYQKRGVAKKLLFEALKECRKRNQKIQRITVNSSPNAYVAYQRLGFKGKNSVETANGIRFIPLELVLDR